MQLNIINNTTFNYLFLTLDGMDYPLKVGEKTEIYTDERTERLHFKIRDKNRVVFNWLFALIDGFISEDSVWLDLNCNVSFDVSFNSENESTVYLEKIKAYPKGKPFGIGECFYSSVYIKGENILVNNSSYSLTECKKEKKKSLFLLHYVVSWLPVLAILILFALFVESGVWMILFFAAMILLFLTIPSFKKAKRFKRYFTDDLASSVLTQEEILWRANNDNPVAKEPKDIISKGIDKILDWIFKIKK